MSLLENTTFNAAPLDATLEAISASTISLGSDQLPIAQGRLVSIMHGSRIESTLGTSRKHTAPETDWTSRPSTSIAWSVQQQRPVSPQFKASLKLEQGLLVDGLQDEEGQYVFIPERDALASERSAEDRMFDLIQPMYEGECGRFFEDSLDPFVQKPPQKPSYAPPYAASNSLCRQYCTINPFLTPFYVRKVQKNAGRVPVEIWGGRDVLVEKMFVLTPDGNGVPVAVVLRKQPDDEWKIILATP